MFRFGLCLAGLLALSAGSANAQFFGGFSRVRVVTPFVATTQVVTPLATTGGVCGTTGIVANAAVTTPVVNAVAVTPVVVRSRVFVVRGRALGARNVVRARAVIRRRR